MVIGLVSASKSIEVYDRAGGDVIGNGLLLPDNGYAECNNYSSTDDPDCPMVLYQRWTNCVP